MRESLEPVSLEEAVARDQGAADERDRIATEQAQEAERVGLRDRAILALVIGVILYAAVVLPLAALILGFSIRLFRLASGW